MVEQITPAGEHQTPAPLATKIQRRPTSPCMHYSTSRASPAQQRAVCMAPAQAKQASVTWDPPKLLLTLLTIRPAIPCNLEMSCAPWANRTARPAVPSRPAGFESPLTFTRQFVRFTTCLQPTLQLAKRAVKTCRAVRIPAFSATGSTSSSRRRNPTLAMHGKL